MKLHCDNRQKMSSDSRKPVHHVIDTLAEHYLKGKVKTIKLAMTTLLAGGHLLLEDIPGLGKTTLAHVLANEMGVNLRQTAGPVLRASEIRWPSCSS